ncbi:hypothetical protein ACSCBZ_46405 [Streptomyces niveiscabiei]|uniref:hypothetical protein n=1 Tax=Streptomyces niveiscabiei TaxID=164115 RepID=UPI0006EB8546|nr:hypothetical protein [Streptomyces niveiscabiei]
MTAADLTPREILKAVAYLEAVWSSNTTMVASLSARSDGERDILDLVIDLADKVGQLDLAARHGIQDGTEEEQLAAARAIADPAAGPTASLMYTWRAWAKTAEGPAVRELSLSVIGYLVLMTRADDVPEALEAIKAPILCEGRLFLEPRQGAGAEHAGSSPIVSTAGLLRMDAVRSLWQQAGELAFPVSGESNNGEWRQAVYRAAALLEPVWPRDYTAGPFTWGLPSVAFALYAGIPGTAPEYMEVEILWDVLTDHRRGPALDRSPEAAVREGLVQRGHDLEDDSQLSQLFRQLTAYIPPVREILGLELPAGEQSPGGTLMAFGAQWAARKLAYHQRQP